MNDETDEVKVPTATKKESESEEGPGRLYDAFAQAELVAERLKLLDYERKFVPLGDSLKPIPRQMPMNECHANELFFDFNCFFNYLMGQTLLRPLHKHWRAVPFVHQPLRVAHQKVGRRSIDGNATRI